VDFSKLGGSKKKQAPTNPVKIFESLPSLEDTPNDLWRGQAKALNDWEEVRNKNDVLIALNTGAGKTIAGLLIAQSLVNEGLENVIYVCSTIDLVRQTALEADRIGIPYSLRVRGQYTNDLFQTGKAFCISTYAALFNGHSSLRKNYFPGAVIFDDAHVAENLLRDAFTLRFSIQDEAGLFTDIAKLFSGHFKELGISGRFNDSLDYTRHATAFVAPRGIYERSQQLLEILHRHKVKDNEDHTFAFAHLEDHIEACAGIFSRGVFELAPPFLPSLALDIFEQKVRRVYLSATLQSQTEFIRAFGREPDHIVTPENDAGNGERLILNGRKVKKGFGPKFVEKLIVGRKAVIAVPDYHQASAWVEIAEPPDPDNFSEELDKFRKAKTGAFTLVSRVDGIDLPHDTCRIMVVDGVPSGASLLERYQWEFLRMNNVHAVRVANRLAQLFGRINRGRNDYGAFLLEGDALSAWLGRDRHVSLLPPLLQKQILIGREVQEEFNINEADKVLELVDRVLGRDKGWLDYYKREVKLGELDKDQLARAATAEPFMIQAALTEARYAAAMWSGDSTLARREIEKTVDETAQYDTPLGGWHSVWLGAAYDLEGDKEAAERAYGIACKRLNRSMTLPRTKGGRIEKVGVPDFNSFGKSLLDVLRYDHGNKFEEELAKLRDTLSLISSDDPKKAEAGVRQLGEIIGFTSTRPDNDQNTGPDVLWADEASTQLISFELKTDKDNPATYFKKEIGQAHDHLEWIAHNWEDYHCLGLLFVGPDGEAHHQANPSNDMGLCITKQMVALSNRVLALIEDLRKFTPIERAAAIAKETEKDDWLITNLVEYLWQKDMIKE